MKQPRFTITMELTYNQYLGLLWALKGFCPAPVGIVKLVSKFEKDLDQRHAAWRREHFKCARQSIAIVRK